MQSQTKTIIFGIFLGLLLFKPQFGTALGNSIGHLAVAAFEPAGSYQTPQQQANQQAVIEKVTELQDGVAAEERAAIFGVIEKIIERLDRLEVVTKPADAAPADTAALIAPGVVERMTLSDALPAKTMDVKQFDAEFDKKFSTASKSE